GSSLFSGQSAHLCAPRREVAIATLVPDPPSNRQTSARSSRSAATRARRAMARTMRFSEARNGSESHLPGSPGARKEEDDEPPSLCGPERNGSESPAHVLLHDQLSPL